MNHSLQSARAPLTPMLFVGQALEVLGGQPTIRGQPDKQISHAKDPSLAEARVCRPENSSRSYSR